MIKFKNGYFTLYANMECEIDKYKSPAGVIFELLSDDINSENLGFKKRTSKTILTISGNPYTFKYDENINPIYAKKISLADLGDVYHICTVAMYHGMSVGIESHTDDKVLLATSDKTFYEKYGFEEIERNVYMKEVPLEDVELVDKRSLVTNFFH